MDVVVDLAGRGVRWEGRTAELHLAVEAHNVLQGLLLVWSTIKLCHRVCTAWQTLRC